MSITTLDLAAIQALREFASQNSSHNRAGRPQQGQTPLRGAEDQYSSLLLEEAKFCPSLSPSPSGESEFTVRSVRLAKSKTFSSPEQNALFEARNSS